MTEPLDDGSLESLHMHQFFSRSPMVRLARDQSDGVLALPILSLRASPLSDPTAVQAWVEG